VGSKTGGSVVPLAIAANTTIEYDVRGEGPPLVLINGMGFGRWGWFKQVPALSRHFRTITFDVRGERDITGGVDDLVSEVVALLNHLGVKKTHVLGASLGGFVAQELALKRPDLVDRLVLMCTSYGGRGSVPVPLASLGRMFGWGSITPETAARKGLEAATSEVYRAEEGEEFEGILRRRLDDSPSLAAYYEQAMAGARFDASREVGRITSPTLVIHGSSDRYVPVANAVALAEAIPGAKLRILEGAGHLVFVERAADVNREVIGFLKGFEPHKPQAPGTERGAGEHPTKRGSAFEELKRWIGSPASALGGWARKVLDRIRPSGPR
jgi:3-oxoadipate enol-lactonase